MKRLLSGALVVATLLAGCRTIPPAGPQREERPALESVVDTMVVSIAREMREQHNLPGYGTPAWRFGEVTPGKNSDYYWSGNRVNEGNPLVVFREEYFKERAEQGRLLARSPCEEVELPGGGTAYADVAESVVRHELAHFYHDMIYQHVHGSRVADYLASRWCFSNIAPSARCLEEEVWIEGFASASEKCSMNATLEKVGLDFSAVSSGGWCRSGSYLQDATCRAIAGASAAAEIMRRDPVHGFARAAAFRLPSYSLERIDESVEAVLERSPPVLVEGAADVYLEE